MNIEKNKYAVIVLAAGNSSRLGQAKQLLKKDSETLLNRTIAVAKGSGVGDVFIVLGAQSEVILPTLKKVDNVIVNQEWNKGLGNSIACGVSYIVEQNYHGVIILLVDQIHLTEDNIVNLIKNKKQLKKGIIVSKYNKNQGPPCYFDKKYFLELISLEGNIGASTVIKRNKSDVAFVSFPLGYIDIDIPSDLDLLA